MTERNGVRVFLDSGVDDFGDRAVVTEVDDLGTGGLQDATHDVDRRVVAVEQARGSDEAQPGTCSYLRWMEFLTHLLRCAELMEWASTE